MVPTLFLTIVWGLWPLICVMMDLTFLETWLGCVSPMAPSQELIQSVQWIVSIAISQVFGKRKLLVKIVFFK